MRYKIELETREFVDIFQHRLDYISTLNTDNLQQLNAVKQQNLLLLRTLNSIKLYKQQQQQNVAIPPFKQCNDTNTTVQQSELNVIETGFRLPSGLSYLKHLHGKTNLLSPQFQRTSNSKRQTVYSNYTIVIGMPTVKREKQSYLIKTIQSLIDNLNKNELQRILIVCLIGEPYNIEYVLATSQEIEKLYAEHIENGLLEIVAPPSEYYPDLNNLKLTLNDNYERVKWRTKQNYDFSYLMMYSLSRGKYYMQLEDDVITKPDYIKTIETFIKQQHRQDWFLLEFSSLGFIGKLVHTSDLDALINFFLLFATDKPIDWLVDYYMDTKYCHFEADKKSCTRTKSLYRIRFKPSLFQHFGVFSSLKGKIQILQDKDFGKKLKLFLANVNPPTVSLKTTLKQSKKYSLIGAYTGQNFFWASYPKANDIVEFTYDPPLSIERLYFESGNPRHPDDRFFNTTVDVRPSVLPKDKNITYKYAGQGFYTVANFSHVTGIAEATIEKSINPISTILIKPTNNVSK
ncbi:unnamed protein product [Didymodactylos carnosus]|uniref:Alpha-1,3-mannosyl-glycoprotein 4-beta-N-acetylglucosaminyltransferase A n=1 Tax=Didymodactylos carnosus TaxID=1234261 RepID=A0A814NT75_9BILA|nr:unnamed protein product [Didymodactylos carnosus]CAF1096155.1 unnamed protein product [Didymodactylos carnosus]CAF3524142.1 unnamed protein product [Didymodactylos carnosus]CAF3861448.1 unnamed protein product [Didymodactylos carnosus]